MERVIDPSRMRAAKLPRFIFYVAGGEAVAPGAEIAVAEVEIGAAGGERTIHQFSAPAASWRRLFAGKEGAPEWLIEHLATVKAAVLNHV